MRATRAMSGECPVSMPLPLRVFAAVAQSAAGMAWLVAVVAVAAWLKG